MIIDNHAHIFPYLGGKSEYESEKIQLMYAQKLISGHFEPTRRKSDFSVLEKVNLWEKDKPGLEGMRDINFKAGRFGRYEWTTDDVDYCKQFMPVSLQDMTAPPEFLIAQMDFVGIDKAVLQRTHMYGKLENYFYDAIQAFPDRFIGLSQINESRAYCTDQISELHRAVDELGLKGLYFEPAALFVANFRHNFDDEIYSPFWDEVDSLSIPIYADTDRSLFLDEMERWENILEKHPGMIFVISLGLPEEIALIDGECTIPDVVHRLVSEHNVFLELCHPISMGKVSEYPYPEAQKIIRHLYNSYGARRLVWGSDMPNVERYSTYAQSLNYFTRHCEFIPTSDKDFILSKNVLKIFGLDSLDDGARK